jgi:hypothetical protein
MTTPQAAHPSVITFGQIRMNNTSPSDITIMLCEQLLQEIQTNVTFNLPDFSISTSQPPVPDESSMRDLPSGSHGETALVYRLQSNLYNHLALFNQTEYEFNNGGREPVDSFFQGVLNDRHTSGSRHDTWPRESSGPHGCRPALLQTLYGTGRIGQHAQEPVLIIITRQNNPPSHPPQPQQPLPKAE